MKTKILSLTVLSIMMFLAMQSSAQKYITKNGYIKFYSETPLETIQADNRQVTAALDPLSGEFVFKVLMKSFQFEKALMQEHFNENYVESQKFPNAMFQGNISNMDKVDFDKPGSYDALVEGELTIHGVTQKINEKGVFTVEADKIKGNSKFMIKPVDYGIKIPKTVLNNIAEEIEVTVNIELSKL